MWRSSTAVSSDWAWSPYTPSADQPWDRKAAAHLFRRAGFGASSAQLDQSVSSSPGDAVDLLFEQSRDASIFADEMRPLGRLARNAEEPAGLAAWWLYRMLHSPAQLLEKLTLFWHGHFATSNAKVQSPSLMLRQNELLRRRALGPFKELVEGTARDPAMLIYLDSKTNRKIHPNENFARELMELFCLGPGNYSERDIQEAARCFTGWEVRENRFRVNRYQHDAGDKQLLGRSGAFDGDDAIHIIVNQPATATFLAAKLYRFYVADEPAPPRPLLSPLVDELRANDLRIEPVIRRILSSNLFFSERSVGRKIRGPVELAVGFLRSLEATCSTTELARRLQPLGQLPFYPPNVKGWDGGRTWINSTTLLGRANLIQWILHDDQSRFAGGTLQQFAMRQAVAEPAARVDWLAELLLAAPLDGQPREALVELARIHGDDPQRQMTDLVHAFGALPEFQLA